MGDALVNELNSLARRFEKPARPPAPTVPTFNDTCKNFLRLRKDVKSYFKEFYGKSEERVKILVLREKCLSKSTGQKVAHLETVKEVLEALAETYVRTDRFVEETLQPIRRMRALEENDHIGLENSYSQILSICAEAKAL